MLPYWFLFILPACLAATPPRALSSRTKFSLLWCGMSAVLVLAVGLRHEVGGDWFSYEAYIFAAENWTFSQALTIGDPAYSALNWLTVKIGLGLYFVNLVCAVVFTWGLVTFCRAQPRPWLTLVVAVPYLVTVVAMGYTRQAVAIGAAMLALVALSEQRMLRFVAFIVMAATFHKSAIILMPLAVLGASRRRIWTAVWVGVSTLFFYILLLQDSVDVLTRGYIDTEYASAGAEVRVAMNIVPAIIFLIFRGRFAMSKTDRNFWSWMSIGGLAFVGLLAVSPSSTAVDRIALYWIPLQLYVFGRLPNALGRLNGRNDLWVSVVVLYSAAVLFVWLVYARTAFAWLPYQFYPWVLLWN